MLTRYSIEEGSKLADRLGVRDIAPNKLVSDLVKLGCSPALEEKASVSTEWVTNTVEEVSNSFSRPGLGGHNEHDAAIEELIASAARGLNGALDLVSNVINPMAKSLKAEVLTLEQERISDITRLPVIIPEFGLNLTSVPFIMELLESHQTGELNHEPKIPDVVADHLKAFSDMTDLERKVVLTSHHTGMDAFTDKVLASLKGSEHDMDITAPSSSPKVLYLAWVYVCHLLKNPPEGVNLALTRYNELMVTTRNQFARLLKVNVAREERLLNSGKMFLATPDVGLSDWRISVNGGVYNQWLNSGGSPEALYGIVLMRQVNSDAKYLTNFDAYVKAYNSALALREARYRSAYASMVMDLMRNRLVRLMSDQNPDLNKRMVAERLDEVIRMYRDVTPDNVDYWIRSIIVRAFYPNSGVMLFIDDLLEQTRLDDSRNANEIGEIARCNFIADYLAGLIIPCQ